MTSISISQPAATVLLISTIVVAGQALAKIVIAHRRNFAVFGNIFDKKQRLDYIIDACASRAKHLLDALKE